MCGINVVFMFFMRWIEENIHDNLVFVWLHGGCTKTHVCVN